MGLQTVSTGGASPHRPPSLAWRVGSSMLMGLTGIISKGFLYGFNSTEAVGMQKFLELLDSRRDPEKRQRGLITVSNHISIVDDPLIWGVLPLKYLTDPANLRWSLAAEDICFQNRFLARFFHLGQTLPTHRFRHSPFGGLFQPSMTEAIRLLSSEEHQRRGLPGLLKTAVERSDLAVAAAPPPNPDPSFRPWGSNAWVHVFPEACVHQQPARGLRYFKWGAARLILESGPSMPDVVPVFIDGTDRIMSEDRGFPRFLPRVGRRVRVVFGEALDTDAAFGDLRRRWRTLVEDATARDEEVRSWTGTAAASGASSKKPTAVTSAKEVVDLEHGAEAQAIRVELARRLRDEVLKLRRRLGYPDEDDPSLGLAESWAREPGVGYTYRSKVDGSIISQR